MITKRYMICLFLALPAAGIGCQGGGGEPLVESTIHDDIDFEPPPNDNTIDPDVLGPDAADPRKGIPGSGDPSGGDPGGGDPDDGDPDDGDPDDNTPCGRTCAAWRQAGCENPNTCIAECNQIVTGDPCGEELQAVIDCLLDAGVCFTEDVATTDPAILQGCSGPALSYSTCIDANP